MQLNKPKITVYITNYNYGKYIKKAIESVLIQTETDNEIIIIDDGSNDDSKSIIETYRNHKNIKIVRNYKFRQYDFDWIINQYDK